MTLLSQNVLILERHTSRVCHPRFVSFAPEDSCRFVVSCLFLFISTGRRGGESWDDGKEGYQHTHPTHTRTRHSRDVLHLLWPLARKAHLHKYLIYYRHTRTHTATHTHTHTYANCISSLSVFISLLSLFASCFAVLILPVRRPYIHKLVEKAEKFDATVLLLSWFSFIQRLSREKNWNPQVHHVSIHPHMYALLHKLQLFSSEWRRLTFSLECQLNDSVPTGCVRKSYKLVDDMFSLPTRQIQELGLRL